MKVSASKIHRSARKRRALPVGPDEKAMTPYSNLSGRSGVVAYEIAPDSITVEFEDGAVYLYTEESAGRSDLEAMKGLADAGRGLSTFIVRHVRMAYAARLR